MSESKVFSALRKEHQVSAKGGAGILRYLLIGGILLLVGFNAYMMFFGDETKQQGGIPQAIPGTTDATGVADLGQLPTDTASAEEGNEARKLIAEAKTQGGANSETLFDQAQNFMNKSRMADAFLLYFYLAKQGHGPSCMALAEMADPAYFKAEKSFFDAPDIFQAHKWYKDAKTYGMNQAEAQLRDLKLRAKAAAAGGDEKMRRLLQTW